MRRVTTGRPADSTWGVASAPSSCKLDVVTRELTHAIIVAVELRATVQ